MSKSIKQLFKAINPDIRHRKKIEKQLKDIENKARAVLKEHHTLDLFYEHSYFVHTPLEAAIHTASLKGFQLLIKLGADLFFKPKPDMPSALEILANNYFSPFSTHEKNQLFEWVLKDKESPVFTWAKLKEHANLFEAFKKAGLIPEKQYINVLPIHVAIEAGRMDLVQNVISAAGSIQKAGDLSHMSILNPAILAVLKGKEHALAMLTYLLEQGASTQTSDAFNLPAIIQAISAGVLYITHVREESVFRVVKLLLDHGATLDVTNPNNGCTPLMSALKMGYKNLFDFFLGKADPKTLNHQATMSPYYLIFQLFDKYDNKLRGLDFLKLLPELKEKGTEFDKTIARTITYADPFGDDSYSDGREVSVTGLSLLHFYLENMTHLMDDPFQTMDHHIAIIQALIANGTNPNAKATYTLTKNEPDGSSYRTQKVQTNIQLTAAEYARKIADKIIGRYHYSQDAFLIKTYQDENEFLKHIQYKTKEEQTQLHKKFHQFRNLERVLAGEKALPYSGLPNVEKISQWTLQKQKSIAATKSTASPDEFDSQTFESELINARVQHNQGNWQALKKSLVDYVKESTSVQNFIERIEEFKKPLQLHFNLTTNSKGEVISYGSTMYRFFHFFDPYKFPNSWETLRKFGQDTYGVDINAQYDHSTTHQL
ncbi:ankyrin repeat domain-containing protein [Legionella resiliens]|uniref:Ankyrin repeat domain-containing protein n=1 Tax=Legionella resiliens TaxID=2905958 RepID=A0ABS8X152_9GAMM|nr:MULTISPECIES: ankyrin repeat domain-containing protein [unclassified Legionella]MCE0722540.1 ankyrin repeat domain-containing protein [Legionella sp. 9fVS26]MCE3531694.1 ankyrin repeat domain-containing protein [Legionella sp. 8cVS16]